MADMTTERTLQQEIADLRAAVDRLEAAAAARLLLVLNAPLPRVFLGQPLSLTAAAQWLGQGPSGAPSPARDLPITFVTSWGLLRAVDGYDTQIGASVTTRTGLDGVARVTLLSAGTADLDVAQQSALWTALDRLDPTAATPADLQPQLVELVGEYRWEANLLLRQAIDILHRANGAPQPVPVNPDDALAAWRQFNATVVAIVGGDDQAAANAALYTVRVLDWLRPWLQVYLVQSQTEESLPRDLDRTRRRNADPGALLDGVYGDINQYVNNQYGVIGQDIGRRVAENALRTFVKEGLAELPAETRVALFPALHTASETVTTAGVHVLNALTQARVDLRREIDVKATTAGSRLDGRVGAVEQTLTGKVDANTFQGFRTEVGASLAALDDQTHTLSTQFAAAGAAAETLLGQLTALQSSFGQLTTNFGTLQNSLGDLSGSVTNAVADLTGQLAARVTSDEFQSFQESTTTALNKKANAASISGLRSELSGLIAGKADLTALDTLKQDTDGRFAELLTNADKLTAQMDEVNQSLSVINDRFGGLQREFTAQLENNQQALTQALATVDQLQATVGALPTDLTTRFVGLEEETKGVGASLAAFRKTVTTLNRSFTTLNKRIVDSGLLRPPS